MPKTAAVPPMPSASVSIDEQRVERPAHESARGVARIHDPAFHRRTSGSHTVGVGLESGPPAPPAAAEERGRRGEGLSPVPAFARRLPECRRAVGELRREVGEHLVALRERQQRAGGSRRRVEVASADCGRVAGHSGTTGIGWRMFLHCRNTGVPTGMQGAVSALDWTARSRKRFVVDELFRFRQAALRCGVPCVCRSFERDQTGTGRGSRLPGLEIVIEHEVGIDGCHVLPRRAR